MSAGPAAEALMERNASVAEFGVETILTVLSVFFAQASTPCLQISYSLPSALHEMEISTAEALSR